MKGHLAEEPLPRAARCGAASCASKPFLCLKTATYRCSAVPVYCRRYDASNAALASDLEELRAAMGPADAATLRQRGTARFQAKDYEGAVEAFSLLLGMHAASVPGARSPRVL